MEGQIERSRLEEMVDDLNRFRRTQRTLRKGAAGPGLQVETRARGHWARGQFGCSRFGSFLGAHTVWGIERWAGLD